METGEMDDILKAMRDSGFEPTANTDEARDFPVLEGKYEALWTGMKPWASKETGEIENYVAEYRIQQTLSGDNGDGRVFSKWHRIGGSMRDYAKDGSYTERAVEPADKMKAIGRLVNDAVTCGIRLDISSTAALEASFDSCIGKVAYLTCYRRKSDGKQGWMVVTKEDAMKPKGASKSAGAGASSAAPF